MNCSRNRKRHTPYSGTFSSVFHNLVRMSVDSSAFYFAESESYDWTTPQNNVLWQDGLKTLFDPCPAGWRVPLSGAESLRPWNSLTIANGPWYGTTDNTDPSAGRMFQSGTVWYGATGGRSQRSGFLSWVCEWCHVWSSTLTPEQYWIFRFNFGQIDEGGQTHAPAIGLSVRCVRE